MRIYLIGAMGSGKSTIGKKLASKISIPFFDLDQLIEDYIGMPIISYFDKFGEDKFRLVEKEVLHSTFMMKEAVIATGGGTPCFHNNMDEIVKNGLSCYIKADINLLISRLKEGKDTRPLIKDLDDDQLNSFLSKMLTDRMEFYERAQFTIDAKNLTTEKLITMFGIRA